MAKYAGSIYRGAYYGNSPRLVYDATPFVSNALSYETVQLYWQLPQGDFTQFRLVRNNSNFPESAEDGTIVWQQVSDTNISGAVSRNSIIDGDENALEPYFKGLISGQFIYYTIFLYTSTKVWVQAGSTAVLIPKRLNGTDRMYNLLPRIYTTKEGSPTGPVEKNTFLYNFLDAFGFTFDQILTYADLIGPSFGDSRLPPQFLGYKFLSYGLYLERGIPFKNQKKLVRESARLFSLKGTSKGITNYVESLTGYSPVMTVSPNLLLDMQDATFKEGFGRWKSAASTLTADSTQTLATGTNAIDTTWSGKVVTILAVVDQKYRTNNVATLRTTINHGLETGDTVIVTNVDSTYNGTHIVTSVPTLTTFTFASVNGPMIPTAVTGGATATGGTSISLGRDAPLTKGIPVTAEVSYTYSFYAKTVANGTLNAALYWYNELGVQIGSRILGTELGTIGQVQRTALVATAPVGAVFAGLKIYFTTPGTYYVDMVQLAKTSAVTLYDEPRGLDVFLEPRKINLISNPSFETNGNLWTTNSAKTLVANVPVGVPGTQSLQLSGTNALSITATCATSSTFKIYDNNNYVFSIYLKASAPCTVSVTLGVTDETGTDAESATEIVSLTTNWKRYYTTLYVPINFSPQNTITMTASISGTLTGQTVSLDNAQVERGYAPSEYFDGSMPSDYGVVWSGTAHASKSFYYTDKNIKIPRLLLTLNEWVPRHIPYRIRSYAGVEGSFAP